MESISAKIDLTRLEDIDYLLEPDVLNWFFERLLKFKMMEYQYDGIDPEHYLFDKQRVFARFKGDLLRMARTGNIGGLRGTLVNILNKDHPRRQIYYSFKCVVSYEKQSTIITNCNHHVLCGPCFTNIYAKGDHLCPLCRALITSHVWI